MNSTPKLMTPAQRDRRVLELESTIAALRALPVATPCIECLHFNAKSGFCDYWRAIVPPEARAAGCAHWTEAVPF